MEKEVRQFWVLSPNTGRKEIHDLWPPTKIYFWSATIPANRMTWCLSYLSQNVESQEDELFLYQKTWGGKLIMLWKEWNGYHSLIPRPEVSGLGMRLDLYTVAVENVLFACYHKVCTSKVAWSCSNGWAPLIRDTALQSSFVNTAVSYIPLPPFLEVHLCIASCHDLRMCVCIRAQREGVERKEGERPMYTWINQSHSFTVQFK